MNLENSFTDFIKYEILSFDFNKEEKEKLVFLFLLLSKKQASDNHIFSKIYLSENSKDLLSTLIKDVIKPEEIIIESTNNFFSFSIFKENINKEILDFVNNLKVNSLNDVKPILGGIFLANGTITSPTSKFYHFEISFSEKKVLFLVKKSLSLLKIRFSFLKKQGKYHLYVKKATSISDLLKALNASNALLYFEDQRILRDLTSNLKKAEAIEKYNKGKTKKAVELQLEAIEKLKSENKFDILDLNLKQLAKLRIENPDVSLSDLNYIYNKTYQENVSKSTINNWIKKILISANGGK